jgi:hypothetical protein
MKTILKSFVLLITVWILQSCAGGYVSTGVGYYDGYYNGYYPSYYWYNPGPVVRYDWYGGHHDHYDHHHDHHHDYDFD